MKMLLIAICLAADCALAQAASTRAVPEVKTIAVEEGAVTTVYLSPGYATSIRLPEEVSSVVVGNPASFKAEHAESEPRLVFLKPITAKTAESNALITTKSGQEISLHLISAGDSASQSRVDFLLEYRRPQSMLIGPQGARSFFVSETKSIAGDDPTGTPDHGKPVDTIATALAQQQAVSTPRWEGDELQAALGDSTKVGLLTFLRFSILNRTKRTVELLPPQIALGGPATSSKNKQTKAEPVPIADYRLSSRRLAPGERADGVIVFDRPSFKELSEKLELQVAEADQVDRPIFLPIPFTATNIGGMQ